MASRKQASQVIVEVRLHAIYVVPDLHGVAKRGGGALGVTLLE